MKDCLTTIPVEDCPTTTYYGHNKHFTLVHTPPHCCPAGDGWEWGGLSTDDLGRPCWTWRRPQNGRV